MSQKHCPSRPDLQAYSVGLLSEDVAGTVSAHIESCSACQAVLQVCDVSGDVLVAQIRTPVVADPCFRERQFQRALDHAEAMFPGEVGSHVGIADVGPAVSMSSSSSSSASDSASSDSVPSDSGDFATRSLFAALDDYHLIEKVGEGGMGAVYKAHHTRLKRMVAIKVLPINRRDDGYAVARFEREMEAVGRIQHANVVQAYDAREIQGSPVLIMEFVEGVDLSKLIRRCGSLPVGEACDIVRQIALGLQAAHEQGLVHRDIKPSNVILTPDGRVKVLDLGLALLRGGEADDVEASIAMTATGQTMGTADYMAPEQCLDSHGADIHSDIYSLGCVLYQLLAGHAPFSGPEFRSRMAKMVGHIQKPVPRISESRESVPDSLVALLDRMLAKSPTERPDTPDDVVKAIDRLPLWDARGCPAADLPALFARYQQDPAGSPPIVPTKSTMKTRASALVDTRQDPAPKSGRLSLRSRLATIRFRPWTIVQGALLVVCVVLSLQIVIRIKDKNGQKTVVKVPSGSTVTIKKDGKTIAQVPEKHVGIDSQTSVRDKTVTRAKNKPDAGQPVKMIPMPTELSKGLTAHWAFDEGGDV